jgi:hypothetical protein
VHQSPDSTFHQRTNAGAERQKSWSDLGRRYLLPAGFFLFFFIYLLFSIDPAVIYSNNGFNVPSYMRYLHEKESGAAVVHEPDRYSGDGYILEITPRYFKELFAVPGGLTRLLVTLIIYSCYYPVAGALAITALAWLFFFLVSLYRREQGASLPLLGLVVPALVVLYIVHLYELDSLAGIVPVAGALASIILYLRMCNSGIWRKTAGLIIIFWSSWYLFQWAALLFCAFAVLRELSERTSRAAMVSVIAAAALNITAVAIVETRFLAPENALWFEPFFAWPLPPAFLIVWFLFLALLQVLRLNRFFTVFRGFERSPALRLTVDAVLVAGLTAAVIFRARYDPVLRDVRATARTVHHLQNKIWDAILTEDFSNQFRDFPGKSGPLQQYLIHARDRCLAQTGALGETMFSYPQATFSAEPLLLRKAVLEFGFPQWASAADLFMELGLVNYAEKTLGELMECMGPYPFLMYRRALLHLENNNSETATLYLKRLGSMPFYRHDAKRLLDIINDSAALAADPRIAHLRSCMDTTDYFFLSCNEEALLRHLLGANPKNRLAFDYLQACYLLTGETEKLMSGIRNAQSLGYTALPRHWEEAICVYMTREDRDTLGPAGAGDIPVVSTEAFLRFDQFMQRYFSLEDDPAAAKKLGPQFGSTYYYFYTFESSYGMK